MEVIEKRLRIAFYERNRYFANRIARTELHRAFSEQRSREWMATDRIQYVQLRLSSKHPKPDICDYFAKSDQYGMGPGVYPKAKAPQPPFHPHCLCQVAPMIALNPKLQPKFNPNAERAFLASLLPDEARQIAGSREKLARALSGETLEEVYNEGRDALYRWRRMEDILTAAGATPAGDAVSNAYEAAKAGGKHAGYLNQYESLPDHLVEKAVRGFEKQIAAHESWIDDPFLKLPPDYPTINVERLVTKKWPSDITRLKEQRDIVLGILKERKR
jgi:hypothetical protein